MTDVLSVIGGAAIVAGVGLWSVPAALIVLGLLVLTYAVLLERGAGDA